ncbi:hypothetical protein KI387_021729 [Taxus chinensis]|uniref:glutathione transferase n=1 Tax=Taxus chinensis TaxID=29808 RepID=A0AA38GE51_TAXCH|nr:hypothetical protein KI387_021729 [Taxus chinensis]
MLVCNKTHSGLGEDFEITLPGGNLRDEDACLGPGGAWVGVRMLTGMMFDVSGRPICILSNNCIEGETSSFFSVQRLKKKYLKMADQGDVKVLSFWASPYVMRVLIGLEEKGINYETVPQTFPDKSPLLLEMNPVYKKVPVLVHNGKPVAESLIALEYIDEVWPSGPALLPADPYERALARFWADYVDKKIYEPATHIFRATGEKHEAAKRELVENLVVLEETLKGKDYFGGDKFGLVDIVVAPQISWFPMYEIVGEYKIPLEEKFPLIAAWMKKCKERESVKKILPEYEKMLQFATNVRKMIVGQV